MNDFVIRNTGSVVLFVAFGAGGDEISVAASAEHRFLVGSQDELYVRGTGGTTDFQASFTVAQGTH